MWFIQKRELNLIMKYQKTLIMIIHMVRKTPNITKTSNNSLKKTKNMLTFQNKGKK